jgi:hypothetical protein
VVYKVSKPISFDACARPLARIGAAVVLLVFFTFISPIFAESYPQIDVSGYKQYQYAKLNVDPISNIFAAQSQLGGYTASGPWQERLKLAIVGKLTNKLSVSYDLEQQPDLPDKFDVKVTYDKTELTFGDFQADFNGNEFANTSKYLNGVMITSHDNWYNLTFVPSSKLKSETQQLVSQRGNNTKGPYNLGHGSIIEGSERIELNNIVLSRGTDYTVDYFSGKITFSRILSTDDEFKYSFEFTNVVDLFFPSVSKRDFVGLQASIKVDPSLLGVSARKIERSIKKGSDLFPTTLIVPAEQISTETITLPPQIRIDSPTIDAYTISVNKVPVLTIHEFAGESPATRRAEMIKSKLDDVVINGALSNEVSVAIVKGEYVLTVKNKTIATATKTEAGINNIDQKELVDLWRKNMIAGLMSTPETIEQVITPEGTIEEREWESTGTYKLTNTPVIPYSEQITFMGTTLKKFEDYIINYDDGSVTLLRPNLPSPLEPLVIEYEYVDVAQESETLPGSGKGPYSLAHSDIISGSETIYVSNIPYIRDLDYKVDYQQGKISFFTNIPTTANIVVKYKYLVMTTPPAPVNPGVSRSLDIGITYLKESGRKGATAPSVSQSDTFAGSDIISKNKTIWLTFMPVVSTSDVTVSRNGATMTYGVDYVFPEYDPTTGKLTPESAPRFLCDAADRSDGLQLGIIKVISDISGTDEISVSYDYSKWSQDRYSGFGTNATRTYSIGSARNMVRGAEQVQIWRKSETNPTLITIQRNSSIDAYDGQYSINYSDPPYITFNSDPIVAYNPNTHAYENYYLNDINFTVIYRFVAQSSASEQPLSHDIIGLDSNFILGDILSVQGSFARSKTDQVFATASTNEAFKGNGSTKTFTMHSSGTIVDGSEQVYLNGQKLNRDDQYLISYDSPGAITFFTITPATGDSISIDYVYQDPLGPVTSVSEKQGNAYKIGGTFKPLNNLELGADYKTVDFDYSPMGGLSIPLGSEYKHVYTKMSPMPQLWPSLYLSGDIKESNVPLANQTTKFLHSYDRNVATGFNPDGIAQVDLTYRDYTTLDDLLAGSTTHANDYKLQSYTMSVVPRTLSYGEYALSNRFDGRKSVSMTDTEDKVLPNDTITDFYHSNTAIDLTRRVRWVLDYQVNLPSTISYESGSRRIGHTIQRQEVNDLSSNLNMDLTFPQVKKLYTYWNKIGHNEFDFIAGTTRSTVNETYHADLMPFDQLSTSLDHNRQEVQTVTIGSTNPKTERTSADIRLTPYSATVIGWSGSVDDSLQEGGIKTSGTANKYSIDHTAISGPNYKLTTRYVLSSALRSAPLGTELNITTDTRTFSQDYAFTINPLSSWSLTTGFLQEDYSNKNDSLLSSTETVSQSQTISVGTSYKFNTSLDLSANYGVKVTKIPDQAAQKAMLDAHAVYSVMTNGTLNYDWIQEENGGEIVGSSFADQDFTRIIQSLSLNIAMPQNEQMILTSIVLKAAVKWAEFMDRNVPTNSYKATLLTFEGTLNF